MDESMRAIEARRFRRLRTFGAADCYCRACGKSDWRFRYERHHIAGRLHSQELIWLCLDCHDWISDMQKDAFEIPANGDPELIELAMLLKGTAELQTRSAEHNMRAARRIIGLANRTPEAEGQP